MNFSSIIISMFQCFNVFMHCHCIHTHVCVHVHFSSSGHKGKYGHEFLEFEFRPDGKLRYANNSNYKNDTMIRKEGMLSRVRPIAWHDKRERESESERAVY